MERLLLARQPRVSGLRHALSCCSAYTQGTTKSGYEVSIEED
jgi:hypothetical protein